MLPSVRPELKLWADKAMLRSISQIPFIEYLRKMLKEKIACLTPVDSIILEGVVSEIRLASISPDEVVTMFLPTNDSSVAIWMARRKECDKGPQMLFAISCAGCFISNGSSASINLEIKQLALLHYVMLNNRSDYQDPGADAYNEQYRQRVIKNLQRRAKKLGFELVPAGA